MREQLEQLKTNHAVFWFDNMYGASVVKDEPEAYCKEGFPYEIAVINKRGEVDFTTPLTNDVLGYLTLGQAVETLEAIANL